MKKFKYRAKKGPDENIEGIVAAQSQDEAVDKINEMGLFPIDVSEDHPLSTGKNPWTSFFKKKVPPREIISFYRQLAKLIKSGVPILRAITLIAEQMPHARVRRVLEEAGESVRQGQSLSSALRFFEHDFGLFDIALIEAGENAGRLDESLMKIVQYRTEQDQLRSKVGMALVYPLFVFLVGLATTGFLLAFVIPKYARFFSDLGQELPLPTRILMGLSQWTRHYGFLVIILFAAVAMGIRKLRHLPPYRLMMDRFLLSLPPTGLLFLKVEIVRMTRTLALLIKSGIPILNALKISEPVLQNAAVREQMEICRRALEDGRYLSDGLRQSRLFPPLFVQLVSLGEESGRLDETLVELADWYEQDTLEAIQVGLRLLEPMVILMVGLILGLLIIAVLLPVFSMDAAIAS